MRIRAAVSGGRLRVDVPTDLPDGTVLDLVSDDEGDDLDESGRAALERALVASDEEARTGQTVDGDVLLAGLRAAR